MSVDGRKATPGSDTMELDMSVTSQVFSVKFDMTPRIEVMSPPFAADAKTADSFGVFFEMRSYNKEMIGLARTRSGVRIMRGPLILAKARLSGCDDRTCFTDIAGLDGSWKASLRAVPGKKTWGAWELTLEGGGKRQVLGVCDYMSAADFDDPRNSFSIWF